MRPRFFVRTADERAFDWTSNNNGLFFYDRPRLRYEVVGGSIPSIGERSRGRTWGVSLKPHDLHETKPRAHHAASSDQHRRGRGMSPKRLNPGIIFVPRHDQALSPSNRSGLGQKRKKGGGISQFPCIQPQNAMTNNEEFRRRVKRTSPPLIAREATICDYYRA